MSVVTLPSLESNPILFLEFSEKADDDLINLVKDRLQEQGLLIISYGSDDTVVIGLTTSDEKLDMEAKAIRLLKRRQDTLVMEAFDIEQKEKYCDTSRSYYDSLGLFSENDRCLLVTRILNDITVLNEGQISSNLSRKLDELKVRYRRKISKKLLRQSQLGGANDLAMKEFPTQSLIYVLEEAGIVNAVGPIHRSGLKQLIWKKTYGLTLSPPVELIHTYYGAEISFYFAWMDFLTRWSFFPAMIGLITYGARWYRDDNIMGDEYTPFYGLLTFVWSVLFLKYWKRHEVRLSYSWGVLLGEYEKQKYFALRPEFHGHIRESPVTGMIEVHYSSYKRRLKYVVSALVTIAMLNAAFWTMILSLNMQGYINPHHDPGRWNEGNEHPFHWPELSKLAQPGQVFDMNTWRSFLPVILHVAIIFTFNNIYRVTATYLTKWENHETQLNFSNSLILKRFMFEAFDCYVALFYLAFYERDISKLRTELISVFNIDTVRRLALECIVPMILQRLTRKVKDDKKGKKTDGLNRKPYSPLSDEAKLDEYEQFDDYMEIIIQFGYVTLFASAYPLASSIMIIANLVEMRSDTFKLSFICRKPRSLRCDGLGMWGSLLSGLVTLSALTNCLIFGFTSGQLMEWLPGLYTIDESDHMRFSDNKGWLVIFIIFGVERALLFTKLLINAVIPDIPEDVMDELQRKHFVQEEESRQYERGLGNVNNSNKSD
mmetsp:Transcript_3712/g.5662  ORF Transcript_3712/g.5662 Transcript_3712/m.5662 type:complete len:715 (-) Transcript_3712:32-2176(-)